MGRRVIPSRSTKQRRWIFYLRNKYKSKDKTPKKWKFIWDEDWKEISEENNDIIKNLTDYLERIK